MQRSPFTCAEEVRADQTRELGTKVLKPKTRDPRGPLSTKSLQKEAPPTKSSTERLARKTSLSLPSTGPQRGQSGDFSGCLPALDPTNISLPRFLPTQTRASEHTQASTHLSVHKPWGARPVNLNQGRLCPRETFGNIWRHFQLSQLGRGVTGI